MWNLPYLDGEERVLVSTKCPIDKEITEQEVVRVIPVNHEATDPMESLNKGKRLAICTKCGNMRLIN